MKKFFYRVQEGDSLIGIANKFNISVFSLIVDNQLCEEVSNGDVLFIDSEHKTYAPLPMEDFNCVSKKIGVPTDELKRLNVNIPYLFYGVRINI